MCCQFLMFRCNVDDRRMKMWLGSNDTDRGKPIPLPFCPPQISRRLVWDWNRSPWWEADDWPPDQWHSSISIEKKKYRLYISSFSYINVSDGVKTINQRQRYARKQEKKELRRRGMFRYVSGAWTFCGGRNIFNQHVTCEIDVWTNVESEVLNPYPANVENRMSS
jgi:hypothetical protein